MGIDAYAAIIVVVLLGLFVWVKRKKIELKKLLFPVLYIVMYRSEAGLFTMDAWARRARKLIQWLGYFGVVVGFVGMVLIAVQLVFSTVEMFSEPAAQGVQLVLPINVDGVFFVPFLYWIICIFVIAVVHEFAHGVVARAHKIPLKSTGFAFFSFFVPIIPAAFVEPDETSLTQRKPREQLSVYAAGPFANILLGFIVLGVLAVLAPYADAMFEATGVELAGLEPDGPAAMAGLERGDILVEVNDWEVVSVSNLSNALASQSVEEEVIVETKDGGRFLFLPKPDPKNASQPFLGVSVRPHVQVRPEFVKDHAEWIPPVFKWFSGLFFWLFALNMGIGLFNLLPVGPLDGGRMSLVAFERWGNRKRALQWWGYVSAFFLILILINIFGGLLL